ncbi:hypothetical protein [Mesorhizobium amorphae]|uniref:hypothetical protein n=1 Tax=Mesorhizobium amorphae TaxID=71433 RepID=UPI001FEE4EAD|nr:hypothetical protein [Mesorhizobium amorphae]
MDDLDANMIAAFPDHLENERANSPAIRNCRRAALRSFFKHLLRNDLDNALRYTPMLALPSKWARLQPARYLEAAEIRAIIDARQTRQRWRDSTRCCFFSIIAARGSAR